MYAIQKSTKDAAVIRSAASSFITEYEETGKEFLHIAEGCESRQDSVCPDTDRKAASALGSRLL